MALKHAGKCMGGPLHGQEWAYFAEEMPLTHILGNTTWGESWKVNGYYKHDGRGLWVWFGPTIEAFTGTER